ncbi:MAG: amino acid ABC transporter permease [Actinomycetota bacterium]
MPAIVALVLVRRGERRLVDAVDPERGLLGPARVLAKVGLVLGLIAGVLLCLYLARNGLREIRDTFFDPEHLRDSFPTVRKGFWLNIKLFVVAEIFVLVWALVVALARLAPGGAAAPLRWLAIAYIDVFRGLPAILTIYLVGFGLPLLGISFFEELDLFWFGVMALTLVYGAYVAEVYRAGIESVHWSQAAAARSLGLSYGQTMRFVVVPQAVRRMIPPLLNDFIGLQKDTALINVLGVLEGFNRARIYAGNNFNLSSMVGLGFCYLVITIPMTRFVDYLAKRDQRRLQAVA